METILKEIVTFLKNKFQKIITQLVLREKEM